MTLLPNFSHTATHKIEYFYEDESTKNAEEKRPARREINSLHAKTVAQTMTGDASIEHGDYKLFSHKDVVAVLDLKETKEEIASCYNSLFSYTGGTSFSSTVVTTTAAPLAVNDRSFYILYYTTSEKDGIQKSHNSLSAIEQIEQIRSSFSLSKTLAAQVLKVTRPTLYGWYDGAEPHSKTLSRISSLASIAEMIPSHTQRFMKSYLKPIFSGKKSLLDLMSEEKLNTKKIESSLVVIIRLIEEGIAKISPVSTTEDLSSKEDIERSLDRFSRPV